MAKIEHPLHLGFELFGVVEVRICPVQGVSGWGFEITFA
jgi:hypothetical protein